MASTLHASSEFLRLQAGDTVTVTITFTNAFPTSAHLWERKAGSPWQQVRENRITPVGSVVGGGGRFTSPGIRTGDVYQVLLYHADESEADPNRYPTDPPPDGAVTVLAGTQPSELLHDSEFGTGGTYFSYSRHTYDETFAVLAVSEVPPVANADGVLEFPAPPTIGATSDQVFVTDLPVVVASADFLQGHDYHALLSVVGRDGRWQQHHVPFTTRLRKVVAQFTQIHIVNDGDYGRNRAYFKGWILTGSTPVSSFYLPERDIWDQPTPGHESEEWIDLNQGPLAVGPVTVGPAPTTAGDRNLLLLTRGMAKVTAGSDTPSANFLPGLGIVPGTPMPGAVYRFPIGPGLEEVEEDDFYVDALPLTSDGEMEYSLAMSVTVTYE